ncbi:MAG: 50S ribosomal protein L25 [Verrucomicrobiia bacterium]
MKSVSLTAYPRERVKRTGVKKVRQAGRVPAVIYGRQNAPQNLEIQTKELKDLLQKSSSQNILVDLSIDGDAGAKRLALLQEVQIHPLSGGLLHVDLHEVIETEKVTITVPVETVGESVGVKTGGGVLEHVLFRLKVRALPKDLPENLEVDVTPLEIGQSVHIGEIKAPEGVEILGDKKVVVLSVAEPLTEAQEAAAEAAVVTPGEPEMIKEKKEEGEQPAAEKGAEKTAPEKGDKAEKAEKPEKKPAEKKK